MKVADRIECVVCGMEIEIGGGDALDVLPLCDPCERMKIETATPDELPELMRRLGYRPRPTT